MKKILFLSILIMIFSFSLEANMARMAPPSPPEKNPHPPVSELDKKRVEFAQNAVKSILMEEGSWKHYLVRSTELGFDKAEAKDELCIKNPICYLQDIPFSNAIKEVTNNAGYVTEMRHPHIIPWSFKKYQSHQEKSSNDLVGDMEEMPAMNAPYVQDDEYLIHIYVRMSKDYRWHHLDVVVKEDKEGKLFLKYFFIIPLPNPGHDLPPGVVC